MMSICLRHRLLVSSALVSLGYLTHAVDVSQAACSPSGTTIVCSGPLPDGFAFTNGGIDVPDGFDTLNVMDLDEAITPDPGAIGINFDRSDGGDDGAITISSETEMTTTGDNARGIWAQTDAGSILVNHTGDITTNGANAAGLDAYSDSGTITINFSGTVTTAASHGIRAFTDGDDADISITAQNGEIVLAGNNQAGIFAYANESSDITITQTGNITATSGDNTAGIAATIDGDANIVVNQAGLINAVDGIHADLRGTGDVSITKDNDIVAERDGIAVTRSGGLGTVDIIANGDIAVSGHDDRDGIDVSRAATSDGAVTITTRGKITVEQGGPDSEDNDGIAVDHFGAGAVTINALGDVETRAAAPLSSSDGIDVALRGTAGSDVSIRSTQSIVATQDGIDVDHAGNGDITVLLEGTIDAGEDGLNIDLDDELGAGHGDVNLTIIQDPSTNDPSIRSDATGVSVDIAGTGNASLTTTGAIEGAGTGVDIRTGDGSASLIVANRISGGAGSAINTTQLNGTSRVEIRPGYEFDGLVDARNGQAGNRLVLGGPVGEAMFDLSQIDNGDGVEQPGEVFFGFDNVFEKTGESNFILTDMNRPGAEFQQARVAGTGLVVLNDSARLVMADGAPPLVVGTGGFGAIGAGGVLEGDIAVSGLGAIVLTNSGPFDPVAGLEGSDDVLTITGFYHSDGGELYLDTLLNDGAVQQTDRLVIEGNAAAGGTTNVHVTNAGGSGGITGRGATDGIRIVDVGGEASDIFRLAGPATVGVFDYDLVQADGRNWYLQTINVRDAGVIKPYISYSLRTFGRAVIGTFYERTGTRIGWRPDVLGTSVLGSSADLMPDEVVVEEIVEDASTRFGAWARILGAWSDADGALNGLYEVSYDETLWAAQAGFDAIVSEGNHGTLVASAFLHYGQIDTESRDDVWSVSAGSTDVVGWGGGVGLTYATLNGLYLDGVASYTRYDVDVNQASGDTGSTHGDGWALSGEAGWRIALSDQVAVTPQAQLVYQGISIDGYTDSGWITTNFSNADSLEGRIGAALEFVPAIGDSTARFYAEANLVHEFLDDPVAVLAGAPLALSFEDTGYDVGLGAEFGQDGGGFSVWVEGDYRAPFDSNHGIDTWSATGGVAIRF